MRVGTEIELFRRARVRVGGGAAASTAFLVSAARAGSAPVIVEASGGGLSASLFRTIDVQVTSHTHITHYTFARISI